MGLAAVINQNQRDESALANVVAVIMAGLYLTNLAVGIGRFLGVTASRISLVSKVLIFAALLRCLMIYLSRINWAIFFSSFLFLLVTAVQGVFFPENVQYMQGIRGNFTDSTFFVFLVTVLPAIFTISVIDNFDILLRRLQTAAVLLSVLTAVILVVFGSDAFQKYSMGFGNAMILPTVLMIRKTADSYNTAWKEVCDLGLTLVDVVSMALFGSRGAFLAIVGYLIYILLWERILQRRLSAILSAAGLLALGVSYKSVLGKINQWGRSHGFYSRTLASFASGKVTDSGRSKIYAAVFRELGEHPFQIRGINYDYNVFGAYCHNWFLELLYAFGVLFGGICCVCILVMMVKTLFRGGKDSRSHLLVILIFAFFPVCLVSGSIWQSTWFWSWVTLYLLRIDLHAS